MCKFPLIILNTTSSFTFSELKQKLADYCVYQDRCQYEVELKMREFILIDQAKEEIMIYLIQNDFLNEERFTKSYIRGKFYQKKWGKRKILNELKKRNIPLKLINSCISEIDETDYLNTFQKLATEKWKILKDKNVFIKKKKLQSYLLQKGYENELIYDFFREI